MTRLKLPVQQKPEYTEGYEGFIHLTDMQGEVEKTVLRYIVRDHDSKKFREKKDLMAACRGLYQQKVRCRHPGADPEG